MKHGVAKSFRTLLILPIVAMMLFVWHPESHAQDYGRIDTLLHWKGGRYVDYVQAYHDTVLVRLEDSQGLDDYFDISYDGGRTWRYVSNDKHVVSYIPGRGSYAVGYDRLADTAKSPQQFWVIRKGQVVFRDTIGYGHKEYPLYIDEMIVHPLDPQMIFYQGAYLPFGGEINVLYVSTNDGRTWRQLDLPVPSQGIGFQVEIRFDYVDAAIWYCSVNGADVFSGWDMPEWHRTTDTGRTFTRIADIGFLNGFLGPGLSMQFPYQRPLPWQKERSRGNPVVSNAESGATDTLPWIQNIYSSLFPNSDTTREIVFTHTSISSNENSNSLGFHPDLPGMFMMRVVIDSLSGIMTTRWQGLVATNDTGKTWVWVIRPMRFLVLVATSIDPKNGSIYLSINATNDPEEASRTYMLLKVTPWAVSVGKEPSNTPSVRAWPNPSSDIVHIHTSVALAADDNVDIIDILGRGAGNAVAIKREDAGNYMQIDVRSIPSGSYVVRISRRGSVMSIPVVVLH